MRLGESFVVLVVDPKLGVRTFADLVALAKSNRGKLSCGSFGNGTISELMLLQLNRSVATEILHVAYKDSTAALTDVMGKQISLMFNGPTVIEPFVKSDQLMPVLTTGKERLRVVPDVPSATELGLPHTHGDPRLVGVHRPRRHAAAADRSPQSRVDACRADAGGARSGVSRCVPR